MSHELEAASSMTNMTLDVEQVLIKTLAGLKALQARNAPPPARMATLLRLADGKRSIAQIVQADGKFDALPQLMQLMQMGWLQLYVATDTQPVQVIRSTTQTVMPASFS
jgi:hypothetical protein